VRLLLFTGLGICCSVASVKARKPGKYFSTSSGVFSLWLLDMFYVGLVNIVLLILQSFECLYRYCFDPNQRESLSTCM